MLVTAVHCILFTRDLLQCYTHNNLGWKIHVVDMGYRSQHNGASSADVAVLSSALSLVMAVATGLVR